MAIPTFNDDPAVFGKVLDAAIESARGRPVVVVDMSTHADVWRLCVSRGPTVNYDPFPDSGGVSRSRNRCVELASTRHVAVLDSADWLSLFDLGDDVLEVPRIMGTSYALDRERVPEPPFDERLGRRPGWPLAMEENVLCEAARAAGFRVLQPRSLVRHHVPRERATRRWMRRRAHAAGRETRLAGEAEPLPRRAPGLLDHTFRALVAVPFLAGRMQRPRPRD